MSIKTKWVVIILIVISVMAGYLLYSRSLNISDENPQSNSDGLVEKEVVEIPVDNNPQEDDLTKPKSATIKEVPITKPVVLPYCVNAFEEHRQIAREYVRPFDNPDIGDDEFVIWQDTATGVGRCNNGSTQSTRFLFGYGEILTDSEGKPVSYVGYLVVDGDSSEVSVFEDCSEKQCEPTQWCIPLYGPSYCSEDGECTTDFSFKGCQ